MFHLCVVFAAKLPDPEAGEVEGRERASQVPPSASQSSGPQHPRKERSQLSQRATPSTSWEAGRRENGLSERLSMGAALTCLPRGVAASCVGKTQQCLSRVTGRKKGSAGIP